MGGVGFFTYVISAAFEIHKDVSVSAFDLLILLISISRLVYEIFHLYTLPHVSIQMDHILFILAIANVF